MKRKTKKTHTVTENNERPRVEGIGKNPPGL